MENSKVGKANGPIDGKIQLCQNSTYIFQRESPLDFNSLLLQLIFKNVFLLPKRILTSSKQCVTDKRHAIFVMTPEAW